MGERENWKGKLKQDWDQKGRGEGEETREGEGSVRGIRTTEQDREKRMGWEGER